jgi:haloacetate dehalogenase
VNAGSGTAFKGKYEPAAMASWVAPFDKASVQHATCEDYRAGATRDIEDEEANTTKLRVPTLILYSAACVRFVSIGIAELIRPVSLARFPVEEIWRNWVQPGTKLRQRQAGGDDVGHFIPIEAAEACVAETLRWFQEDLGLAR